MATIIKRCFALFLILAITASAQTTTTTVTISNTVKQASVNRFGMNLGGIDYYQQHQYLRNLNYANGGNMPSGYYQTTFTCQNGGLNDTTHWYSNTPAVSGFAPNFWVTAPYVAYSAATGLPMGSGTFTASTTNSAVNAITAWSIASNVATFTGTNSLVAGNVIQLTGFPTSTFFNFSNLTITSATGTTFTGNFTHANGSATESGAWSTGLQFTLSSPMSAACNPANQDALVVRFTNASPSLTTPQTIYSSICAGATFNTTDTSPASTNTIQSLQLPAACSWTYGMDVASRPGTNTNPAINTANAAWIDLNGVYTLTFKHKCTGASATLQFSLGRNGGTSYIGPTTVTPTCNNTAGAGWTTFTNTFSATETGSQANGGLFLRILNTTGTMLVQDIQLNEGTAIAPANNTIFRDAVVKELRRMHLGSIRFMDGSDWCSTIADETGPAGNNRFCAFSEYGPAVSTPVGYDAKIALCLDLQVECFITVGVYNQPADWVNLAAWLSTNTNALALKALGHKVHLEMGNEAWNFGSQGQMYQGNGTVYGYNLGRNIAAFKGAAGYDPTFMVTYGDGWFSQGWTSSGQWGFNAWTAAAASGAKPDCGDQAPYTLNYLQNFDTSGSDVSTTGAPFLDAIAENTNFNMAVPPSGSLSMAVNVTSLKNNFGGCMAIYEANEAILFGQAVATTQTQMDELMGSWGEALPTMEGFMLNQRDSGVTGPINIFTFTQDEYAVAKGNSQIPLWGTERLSACGPGEIVTCNDPDRPLVTAMRVYNNAMGNNTQLMTTTQSGTPTFSYPGGQSNGCVGFCYSISANPAVPQVQCAAYTDGANHWFVPCFNNDLVNAQNVAFTGVNAPTGTMTESILPGGSNTMISHNENSYLSTANSIAPFVVVPTPTTVSGTVSICAGCMVTLNYTLGVVVTNNTSQTGATQTSGAVQTQ